MTSMLPPSEEKRQFPRAPFEGQALIRTERHATFIPCEPRNVSLGGMCLRLNEDVELRSEVDVQLVAASSAQPIECHGRVNWTTARLDVQPHAPVPYDVGIEFVGVSPQIRAALAYVIEAWKRQQAAMTP